MSKVYMLTIPRGGMNPMDKGLYPTNVGRAVIQKLIESSDCKKWIIAREQGYGGYKHWQVRMKVSDPEFFTRAHDMIPSAHIEESEHWSDYERKECDFFCSDDTIEVLKIRHGKPKQAQEDVIRAVRDTNDREVVIWYDPNGNSGKSWICGYLWETGQAHYIPPYLTSVQSMIQTVASLMADDRREIVVIDIPRTWKWSGELYTAIEAIKDGLIMDPRYSARPIHIRGVKVLVMTNTMPKLDNLSKDRWVFYPKREGGGPSS